MSNKTLTEEEYDQILKENQRFKTGHQENEEKKEKVRVQGLKYRKSLEIWKKKAKEKGITVSKSEVEKYIKTGSYK